ncbi:unnamed protein product [Calypogeia fissa]
MDHSDDDFGTLHKAKVEKIWGLCAGSFVYEGCGKLLRDGRPCALGKYKRNFRRQNPESPLGPHSRGRVGHTCSEDGAGVYMFCFAIQVGDFVIQVNEINGKQLLGISGQAYKESHDIDDDEVNQFCCVPMKSLWTIRYVKNHSRGCEYHAVNFEKCSQVDEAGSSVVLEADDEEVESNVKQSDGAQWFGKLKGRVLDFGGSLAESLRSFSIFE